ncbi:MAG TPA: hypothetical protein VK463_11050 [Desulfomonilaceae bacterium]|nr:hypothetical protein [Desulfomonilaceae bacterium]
MESSRVLARIVGPLLVISAVGIFLNLEAAQRLIEEYSKSFALCYLGGFMALLLGLVILQFQKTWETRWPVVITILGWIAVVKGAVLIVFPRQVLHLWSPIAVSPYPLIVSSAVSLAAGVFLTIKGYRG